MNYFLNLYNFPVYFSVFLVIVNLLVFLKYPFIKIIPTKAFCIQLLGKNRQIIYEKPSIPKTDALKMELENFVKAVKGEEDPIVDGLSGRNALKIAIEIQNKILEDLNI